MAARPAAKPVRPMGKVAVNRPAAAKREVLREVTFGNVRVSESGIEFLDGAVVPERTVSIDELDFKKELGKGAQGSVGLYVMRSDPSKKFAVKTINLAGKDPAGVQKVAAEIRNIFTQRSEYVIALHNAFLRDGKLLLVMEYMDWGNMEELEEVQPQLSEAVTSYIACQLLHSLALLHSRHRQVDVDAEKRQIHRDIKPANLLIGKSGACKLADFGVAASAETIGVASFVGTVVYMSPARVRGERYGTPSDIWSVGVVVAQALLGRFPFASAGAGFMALLKEVTSINGLHLGEGFTPEAQDFVNQCLRQEEQDRATAAQLLEHPWITRFNGTAEAPTSVGREALVELLNAVGDFTKRELSASTVGVPPMNNTQGTPVVDVPK